MNEYDPFARGRFPVGVRTVHAADAHRNRQFACEIWYPAATQYAGQDLAPGTQDMFTLPPHHEARAQTAIRDATAEPGLYPLIMYSHPSGAHRRAATFLCTHLSSHGYVVAALDHSEVVALDLARRDEETEEQKAARRDAVIASRVPDVRFLLDQMLTASWGDLELDPARIGIVGHSFGGWTALAAVERQHRRGTRPSRRGGVVTPQLGAERSESPRDPAIHHHAGQHDHE